MKTPKRREWTRKWGVKLTDSVWLHTSCNSYDPLFSSIAFPLFSQSHPVIFQHAVGDILATFLFLETAKPPLCCPLYSHYISSSFHCLCSYHLSVEPNPVIHSLIQWVLSAWLFICLHLAVLSAEVLSICPNRQNTGSVFILYHYLPGESWPSTYLLLQHCTLHSCTYIHTHGKHNCPLLPNEPVHWDFRVHWGTGGFVEQWFDECVLVLFYI